MFNLTTLLRAAPRIRGCLLDNCKPLWTPYLSNSEVLRSSGVFNLVRWDETRRSDRAARTHGFMSENDSSVCLLIRNTGGKLPRKVHSSLPAPRSFWSGISEPFAASVYYPSCYLTDAINYACRMFAAICSQNVYKHTQSGWARLAAAVCPAQTCEVDFVVDKRRREKCFWDAWS